MSLNLSASTWNYLSAHGERADLPMAIGEISESGLGVELWLNWWINPEAVSPRQWPEIDKMLDGARVSLHSALNTWDSDGFNTEIKLAKYVGASVLVIHAVGLGLTTDHGEPDTTPCIFASDYADSEGVVLALENDPSFESADLLETALDAAPKLGMCIDLAHAFIVEPELPELITRFGQRIVHVHASDNHGKKDDHLIPGDGGISAETWQAVFRTLAGMDYAGEFVMEIRSPDPKASSHKGGLFLQKMAEAAGFV